MSSLFLKGIKMFITHNQQTRNWFWLCYFWWDKMVLMIFGICNMNCQPADSVLGCICCVFNPRGGNLFKISHPCWVLSFWIIRGIIIMVGLKSSNYPQHIQLSPKHQSGEFWCSWEVKLYNSIILVVHVCKQGPIKRHAKKAWFNHG